MCLWSSRISPKALPHRICSCFCLDICSRKNKVPAPLCHVAGTLSYGLRMSWAVSPSLLWSPLGPCLHLRHLWGLGPSPGKPSQVPECSLNKWFHNCRINSTSEGKDIWKLETVERIQRRIIKESIHFHYYHIEECLQAQYFHLASFTFIVHCFINEGTEWKVA